MVDNTLVYSTKTPYSTIEREFLNKFTSTINRPDQLQKVHSTWRRLGKLAQQGMVGNKYI